MSDADRLRHVSSRQNALVKELRRTFHDGECTAEGDCAIEGVRQIEEAIRSGLRVRAIFFSESAKTLSQRLLPQISSHAEALLLPDAIFASAVATESPQGVAALVRVKQHSLEEVLSPPNPLVAVVAGVQDPGTLGTIVRSAEAFGASAVLLGEGTVSAFNSKAVRAAAGSLFRLPVIRVGLATAIAALRERRLRLIATSSHKGTPLDAADLTGALAFFIGSEGTGLPRALMQQMDEIVSVPHSARVESLNAAVAASILFYETSRQRKRFSPPGRE